MILGVFSIYDTAVSTWMPPMHFRNKGEALRWFQDSVNNPETKLNKHPSDFVLFELGSWDDHNCHFDVLKAPSRIGIAQEFLKIGV